MKKEMIDNIVNYADQIITLEDFVAAVRQNIGMYIGRKGNFGFINMVREVTQNSFDEVNKDESPATEVYVKYNEKNKEVLVADNGRGIPFGNIIRIFSEPHTGANFVKKKGEYSSGMHGVGSKVTNALSKYFIVDSYILGEHRRVEFNDGHPITDEYTDRTDIPKDAQGTTIRFSPAEDVLGVITVTAEDILALLELLLPITKIGTKVIFDGEKLDDTIIHKELVNEDGMISNLIIKTNSPLIAPIHIFKDTGEMKIDCYFTYDSDSLEDYNITSFANFCPTTGGMHVKGVIDGLCKYFKTYMNKVYLASSKKKNKLIVTNQDVLMGLKCIVHTCHLQPIFTGQAKEELGNEDIYPFVRDTITETLEQWSIVNSKDLQKLCKFFKDIAEVRVNAEKGRAKISLKAADVLTGMPQKYIPANGKKSDGLELFIVEGDSAKGSMENSRNKKTQAVFPVRGKTPNPFTTSSNQLLNNEEIKGIFTIMGAGYGRNFKIEDCLFESVILAADRDPDGSHILVNLSSTFGIYTPGLIQAGRLYKSLPPLYSVKINENKRIFFGTRIEYVEYLQGIFSKKNNLVINGKVLDAKGISHLAYDNIDYVYEIDCLSRNYALNPRFLESIIRYLDLPFDQMTTILKNIYGKTIEIKNEAPFIVISGLINNMIQTLYIDDRFYQEAKYIKDKYLYDTNVEYSLNGKKILWLYDVMKTIDTGKVNVTRYKGLGEMDPSDLYETTMNPENRVLVRYTFDNLKEDIAKLREYDSAKGKKDLSRSITANRIDILG